jgi:hypothetical protein
MAALEAMAALVRALEAMAADLARGLADGKEARAKVANVLS